MISSPRKGVATLQSLRRQCPLITPALPERRVLAVPCDQLVVRSQLRDLAVDDHADAVGVVGGVESVRDGDDGASVENRTEGAFEMTRGTRVQQRGRLVEYQGVGIGQDAVS